MERGQMIGCRNCLIGDSPLRYAWGGLRLLLRRLFAPLSFYHVCGALY
jgi:hypothetical protein